MSNFIVLFIVLSIINVIFSTVRQLVTNGNNKVLAALLSGGYFAFYNVMMIVTVTEFPLWQKCLITFFCNVVGVYIVKWAEEKARKDKLWLVQATIPARKVESFLTVVADLGIPYNYVDITKYYMFNFYCSTQMESAKVRNLLTAFDAKYFVSESKTL